MKKIILLLLIVIGGGLLLTIPSATVRGQSLSDEINRQNAALAGEKGAGYGRPGDLRVIIARIIKIFLSFLGTIFVCYTIYGGVLIMTAAGNADNVEKGRKIITNGVIGVALILSSYTIAWFIYYLIYSGMQNPWGNFFFFGQEPDTSGFYQTDPLEGDTVPFRYGGMPTGTELEPPSVEIDESEGQDQDLW